MSPLRGERADKPTYRILDRLGDRRGDDVFLAHHEIFNGKCVQKTVFIHGLEDALASNEPAFLNRLDHQCIVPVREAQWDPEGENAITFVMPWFPGGSVDDALKEDFRFSIAQAVTIAVDALDGLAYLRREFNAVHRDTKPGNVLLDKDRVHGYLTRARSSAHLTPNSSTSPSSSCTRASSSGEGTQTSRACRARCRRLQEVISIAWSSARMPDAAHSAAGSRAWRRGRGLRRAGSDAGRCRGPSFRRA